MLMFVIIIGIILSPPAPPPPPPPTTTTSTTMVTRRCRSCTGLQVVAGAESNTKCVLRVETRVEQSWTRYFTPVLKSAILEPSLIECYCGLGMDVLVNELFKTQTLSWLGHGCFSEHLRSEREHCQGMLWSTNSSKEEHH